MRRIVLVAVAFFVGAGSAACGSSNSSSTADTPSSTASTAPGASTTVGSAATPAVTSTAFDDGKEIPRKYGCEAQGGANDSPPLAWTGFPRNDVTLVLVVHDPDAPVPGGFTHLVTTMPPGTTSVADGANASDGPMQSWTGPCPPSGTHHYVFTLYAFGPDVNLPSALDKKAVDAIASEARMSATLTGLFTSR